MAPDRPEDVLISGSLSPAHVELMLQRFVQHPVPVNVSDVQIQGNTTTWSFVIDAQLDRLRNAATSRELLIEAALAVRRIEKLGLFEDCTISLDNGPDHGSVNVVVTVKERRRPISFDLRSLFDFKEEKRSLEGRFMWKNLFGCGESWDCIGNHGLDENWEMTAALYLPRLKNLPTFLKTQASLLTRDWLQLSSYKLRLAGLTIGLVSEKHQDLSFTLNWPKPNNNNISATRFLLPSMKYVFTIDKRDSVSRPTKGYALRFATQLAGTGYRMHQYSARQDIDCRLAIPMRTCNAALNIGLSGGIMLPWPKNFFLNTNDSTALISIGNYSSLVSDMNGPMKYLDLCCGARQFSKSEHEDGVTATGSGYPILGGLALSSFVDLSFDIPLEPLKRRNIYGHCFLGTGNIFELTQRERQNQSFQKFLSTFKSFAGVGIVIPTRFFRIEVNFCQVLGQFQNGNSKGGIRLSFSSHS